MWWPYPFMFIPRFQLVKCPSSSFYEEIYWLKVILHRLESICLDTNHQKFQFPHAKIFPYNPPDQKFHRLKHDWPRDSLQKYLYITNSKWHNWKILCQKITRLSLQSFQSMWNFWSGGLWGNICVCSEVTKFGIFEFMAVGVKADRLKPVRNDFQSVQFCIERQGGGILQAGMV